MQCPTILYGVVQCMMPSVMCCLMYRYCSFPM
jgi:hypothetical protein